MYVPIVREQSSSFVTDLDINNSNDTDNVNDGDNRSSIHQIFGSEFKFCNLHKFLF
jgi:hypothetical protein